MRYSYELIHGKPGVEGNKRVVTTVSTCSLRQELTRYKAWTVTSITPYFVEVCDNLTHMPVKTMFTYDDLEAWETARERDIWREKDVKAEEIKALAKLHPWEPFDETESGIHVKHMENPCKDLPGGQFMPRMPGDYREILERKGIPVETDTVQAVVGDSNRKNVAASGKPRISGVPPIALFALGAAMQNGVDKYGRFNWRDTGSTASVFYDAMMRHLTEWYSGDDYASDSGVHHLAHLMAGAGIILDTIAVGKLKDDRDRNGPRATDENLWRVKPKSQ